MPTPTTSYKSLYHLLHNHPPDYSTLRTFGCSCYQYLLPYHNHKFQFRSTQCIFLGYSANHKGYKCLSTAGRLYISDTVSFDETDFPYPKLFPPLPPAASHPINPSPSPYIVPTDPSPLPPQPTSFASNSSPYSASSSPSIPSPTPLNHHPMLTRSSIASGPSAFLSPTSSQYSDDLHLFPYSVSYGAIPMVL